MSVPFWSPHATSVPDASWSAARSASMNVPSETRRRKFPRRRGRPVGLVKMSASSSVAVKRARCRARSGAMGAGKATTRRPASVLGGPKRKPPPGRPPAPGRRTGVGSRMLPSCRASRRRGWMALWPIGSGRVRVMAAAAVGLGVILLSACSSAAAPAGSSALNLGMTVFTAASAPRVPPVAGSLVGGGKLSLTAYRGHVVVMNFWGSWCTVCRQEAPALSAVAQHSMDAGVRFVGVDIGDNAAAAKAFMRNFQIRYPSLSDTGDSIALRFSKVIPIAAFPSTLVISADGRIAGRIIGAASARSLMKLIKIAKDRPE